MLYGRLRPITAMQRRWKAVWEPYAHSVGCFELL